MKKRILSLILALTMCVSVLSTIVIAGNDGDAALGDTLRLYNDRVWAWQTSQFEAMTDEQLDVIANAYDNYLAESDTIKGIAADTAATLFEGADAFFEKESLNDLYKWKLMRDIMEERIDVSIDSDEYVTWLSNFTAFELADDEIITPAKPNAALDEFETYSVKLAEYFGELMEIYYADKTLLTGEDADKFAVYADKFLVEMELADSYDEDAYKGYLADDCIELTADGIFGIYDMLIRVICGELVRDEESVFEEISDRDFKATILLLGEDVVRYYIESIPAMRDEVAALDKKELISSVAKGKALNIMNSENQVAASAMYSTMDAIYDYIEGQGYMSEVMGELANYGIDASSCRTVVFEGLREAMSILDESHGVELIHFDIYLGRAFVRPDAGTQFVVDPGETKTISTYFAHDRYKFIEEAFASLSLAEFDAVVVEGEGVTVSEPENIGEFEIVVDEDAVPGRIVKINLYRGYNIAAFNDEPDPYDAYRYVATYEIKIAGEEPVVEIEDIADTTVDGEILVKGETNLPYVTVAITELVDGEVVTLYAVVYSKVELAEGITLRVPADAAEGKSYTVVVGTELAVDSSDFTIIKEDIPVDPVEYYVNLNDVVNTTVDGEILVKGETNLPYVTVAITEVVENEVKTVYAVVYSKDELESGILLNTPFDAEVGKAYTVVVGTELAVASDDFTIIEEDIPVDPEDYFVEIDYVADTTVDGSITVKGETNLPYVTVAITEVIDGETKTLYAVIYTKDEFESGITLNVPSNAEVGKVYNVVVGTEIASDVANFEIVEEEIEYYITLDEIASTTTDGVLIVKGTTNMNTVKLTIEDFVDGAVVVVFEGEYTAEEFAAGIEIDVEAAGLEAKTYTVVVSGKNVYKNADVDITSSEPGDIPSDEETDSPSDEETDIPSDEETDVPSDEETDAPSDEETDVPSDEEIVYYVAMEGIDNTTVDSTFVVKAETNLDYATVAITQMVDGVVKTKFAIVYSKAELREGITLRVPSGAKIGDIYTVIVGTEAASDSDSFVIVEESVVEQPYVTIDDVANTTSGGTVFVKGTTNLDTLVVAIVEIIDGQVNVIANEEISKAAYEEGIELIAPETAETKTYTVIAGNQSVTASDDFVVVVDVEDTEHYVTLNDITDIMVGGSVVIKGETNLDTVKVTVIEVIDGDIVVVFEGEYTAEELVAGIKFDAPADAELGKVYTAIVGSDDASASDSFAVVDPFANLEDIEDEVPAGTGIEIGGTTNVEELTVTIITITPDGEVTVEEKVITRDEYEQGIEYEIPEGTQPGTKVIITITAEVTYTNDLGEETVTEQLDQKVISVVESTSGDDETDEPTTDESETDEPTTGEIVSGSLAVGSLDRKVKVGKTIQITATPQNISPEGADVHMEWTYDEKVLECVDCAVADNGGYIYTFKRLASGTTEVKVVLYVNGQSVDEKVITVKVPSSGGGGGGSSSATTITIANGSSEFVKNAASNAVSAEFVKTSGLGSVEVSIVDGQLHVTATGVGTVNGEIRQYDANGMLVSTGDYKFVVTEGDVTIVDEHKCQWPDIAATATEAAHWAHLTIDQMTANGYISGYPDGTFKPDQSITRAEFAAIVYRILGLQAAEDGVLYDDTVGHWAEDLVATMSLPEGYGMLRGYGDGNFGPDDYITREQAVAIIARAKSAVWVAAEEGAKDVFTDAESISWWFDGEMDSAVTNGLITGYEDGSYRPLNYTTRAEACTLLARAWPEVVE